MNPRKPIVLELRLEEETHYARLAHRDSVRDRAKLADGLRGDGWRAYREREGAPFRFPPDWTHHVLDASRSPAELFDQARDLLPEPSEGALLALVLGDAGVGKSKLVRSLVAARPSWTPLLIDWFKDPLKRDSSVNWSQLRRLAYAQTYFAASELLSWRRSVLLEGTFRVEMSDGGARWCSLIEDVASGDGIAVESLLDRVV
ncbi:MAG: hypothetical protein AAF488_17120 [Planctomycetota bacterium]